MKVSIRTYKLTLETVCAYRFFYFIRFKWQSILYSLASFNPNVEIENFNPNREGKLSNKKDELCRMQNSSFNCHLIRLFIKDQIIFISTLLFEVLF